MTYVTRNSLRDWFSCDPRTAISRYGITADAVLLEAGREVLLFSLEQIVSKADKLHPTSVVANINLEA